MSYTYVQYSWSTLYKRCRNW